MALGEIQAHANGIAGLAIMNTGAGDGSAVLAAEGGQGEDVGGLLVTCGNAEGVVKIWDYTHVEDNGSCGRYSTRRGFVERVGWLLGHWSEMREGWSTF